MKDSSTQFLMTRRRSWKAIAVQSLFLFGMWLILSGYFDLFHVSLGVFSVLVVNVLNYKINRIQFYTYDIPEWERIRYGKFVLYLLWLLWQIVVASLQVAYVVLHPRLPINPAIVKFKVNLPNEGAKVILGNSITLTPGTVTVEIDNDQFTVHALLDESFAGIVDGEMPSKVRQLFLKPKPVNVITDIKVIRDHNQQ